MTANFRALDEAREPARTIPANLFILELANNHMGDVEHGIGVIRAFAEVCRAFPFTFAFKMQYRQLDTFIHPDYQGRDDIKYIKRFSETRLSRDQSKRLVEAIRAHGFVPICTPFDEASVDAIVEDGFEILKIGSCSFTDWPLLERVAKTDKPIIASTAGASLQDIDNVVGFLEHRGKDFVLMHCVAEYPTPAERLQLNQIDLLKARYPQVRIGYSTHETPGETMAAVMTVAKGCTVFEKHVGVSSDDYALNDYSVGPEQLRDWLTAVERAFAVAGVSNARAEHSAAEMASLTSLRRGVFAKRDVAAGERLGDDDVFMAIPTQDGHITANDWSKYNRYYAVAPIRANEAVLRTNTRVEKTRETIYSIVQRVKDLLGRANIVVPGKAELEISHHYGIERFDEFGATMITVVNRTYCKKLIAVLPGQKHPAQYHEKKEETFHVLHGSLRVTLNGLTKEHAAGDVVVVEPGVHHEFESADGAVFEEISSTHHANDSFYVDPVIQGNPDRKTFLTYWMN